MASYCVIGSWLFLHPWLNTQYESTRYYAQLKFKREL